MNETSQEVTAEFFTAHIKKIITAALSEVSHSLVQIWHPWEDSVRLEEVHSPSILDYPFETTNLGGTDFDGV